MYLAVCSQTGKNIVIYVRQLPGHDDNKITDDLLWPAVLGSCQVFVSGVIGPNTYEELEEYVA